MSILRIMEGPGRATGTSCEARAEQVVAVAHAVLQEVNARMSGAGLSLARARRVLVAAQPMRRNELSSAVGVVPRTMSPVVDARGTDGLVSRTPAPDDRRAMLLRVADAGRRQMRTLRTARGSGAAVLFASLTLAERRQLARLLARVRPAPPRRSLDRGSTQDRVPQGLLGEWRT